MNTLTKVVVVAILAAVPLSAQQMSGHQHKSDAKKAATSAVADSSTVSRSVYVCPMHPEVTSEKPGKCPKCKMALVKKAKETEEKATYVCPMHPDVTSDKPGKCPKCKMALVKSKK
jgi:rubrerythrin